MSFIEVLKSDEFQHYLLYEDFLIGILYASVLIVLFNFTRLMYRKLGQRTLGDLITGKYVNPVKQNKIVMFLQIANTESFLHKLGRVRFNDFLNDFIFDITEPILAYRGEIYEYIEDQVVVVWNYKSGISDARCIRAYFEAKDELLMKKEKYVQKYNMFPRIQAAYHAGSVVKGEIGVIKEILEAKPTDGLWADGRSDEDQIGATYPELEWAMEYKGDEVNLSERNRENDKRFEHFMFSN